MDPSLGTSSFLCFLPQAEGRASSLVYVNGINESSNIPHFSIGAIPLKISRIKSQSDDRDLPDGGANYAYTVLKRSTGYYKNVGNTFQKGVSEVEKGCGIQEKSSDERGEKTENICLDNRESNASRAALRDILPEEENDELTFEITEFFKSFSQQQMHLKSVSTSISTKPTLIDGCPSSYRSGSLTCEEDNDGEMSSIHTNSVGHSMKWNGFDSTSSRLLSFSGQQFSSGHLCQAPHSGSVSHRSDSSTTSTHSFAFPMFVCLLTHLIMFSCLVCRCIICMF